MRLLFVFILLAANYAGAAEDAHPDYHISGEAQLLSHFIHRGLSYSDNNPAMNASFLFHLGPQLKLGFWGSNIANLSAVDDNFWLKMTAKMDTEFTDTITGTFYIADNRFYKSDSRNGQNIGYELNYKGNEFLLEWMSNYEGAKTAAEYVRFGRLFDYKKKFRFGGYAGITYTSNSSVLQSYMDLRAVGQFIFSEAATAEGGVTFNSNAGQFGKRGDPGLQVGIKLSY